MSDVYTDTTALANLLVAGYDRVLEHQLRSEPIFRQFVDVHPQDVTTVGPTVTLSIVQELGSLATTPLSEDVDVAAVAQPAPVRVTVTLNEYGNASVTTIKTRDLAFTNVDPTVAYTLGKNMVDTMDKLVQNTLDAATNVMGYNAGVLKSNNSSFAEGSVAGTDIIDSKLIRTATAKLRGRNAPGIVGDNYAGLIHPDVAVDIRADTGWLSPHQYVDTTNIYNAEIGTYLGVRFVETPRATKVADGATGTNVYRTYLLGRQALVEALVHDAHPVIGPQTDRLRRFFPMGWYANAGWSIFRQETIEILRTASSIAAV